MVFLLIPFPSVDLPKVIQHPDQQIPTGGETTFSIKAVGDNLTISGRRIALMCVCNDNRHIGAATHTLTIRQVNNGGCYKCVVKNEVKEDGEVSEEAQLTVCEFHLILYTALSVVVE